MASAPSIADWRLLTQSKRDSLAATIPQAWRLPTSMTSQFHKDAALNVLDVPRKCGILTPQELDITENHDATQLVELMAAGTLKSIDVVTAFCKRAAIAQQCISCLTETMFDSALARARECDDHLARTGTTLGPLHGLPVSLKDSFNVRGVQSTIGYAAFIARPPVATNGILVDMLLDAGAVLYVKTNLPQTMMTADSHNNVFGRTLNPWNLSCTAGGSTGGEGSLLAMRGSVLGAATDIAGSIRIPALCCGVTGFKPSSGRVPIAGEFILCLVDTRYSSDKHIHPCTRSPEPRQHSPRRPRKPFPNPSCLRPLQSLKPRQHPLPPLRANLYTHPLGA
jgi:amidase